MTHVPCLLYTLRPLWRTCTVQLYQVAWGRWQGGGTCHVRTAQCRAWTRIKGNSPALCVGGGGREGGCVCVCVSLCEGEGVYVCVCVCECEWVEFSAISLRVYSVYVCVKVHMNIRLYEYECVYVCMCLWVKFFIFYNVYIDNNHPT